MEYAIIAAGKGERMTQEGATLPKPLTRINGEPMIDRLLKLFVELGAERIHVILNDTSSELIAHLSDWKERAPIRLVVKNTDSSLHSFAALTASGIEKEILLTTVDTIFRKEEFEALVRAFQGNPGLDGMMAVTSFIDDEKPLYVRTDNEMFITAFEDEPYEGARFISGGIYCLRQRAIDIAQLCVDAKVSRMRNYQRALLGNNLALAAFPFTSIVDVDHLADVQIAENLLNEEHTDIQNTPKNA